MRGGGALERETRASPQEQRKRKILPICLVGTMTKTKKSKIEELGL